MDFTLLYFFIPVFAAISITPGLCMTLALTMGMRIGVRHTMKMMVGELVGVLLIVTVVVVGGGGFIASHPLLLTVFKYVGGAYLVFVGIQMMQSRGVMAVRHDQPEFRLRFFTMDNCRACESWKRANLEKTRENIPVEIVNLSDPKNRRWLGSQTIDGKAIERIRIVPTFWILRRGRNLPERLEQWTGGRSADQIAATLRKIPK